MAEKKAVAGTVVPKAKAVPAKRPAKKLDESAPRRKFDLVTAGSPMDSLPAGNSRSVPDEVLQAIIDADGKYVPIEAGGRTAASASAVLIAAAKRKGLSIRTATRGGQVYAWLVK